MPHETSPMESHKYDGAELKYNFNMLLLDLSAAMF